MLHLQGQELTVDALIEAQDYLLRVHASSEPEMKQW